MSNVLKIQGVSVQDLAKEYGTPLYIYDEGKLKEKLSSYKTLFTNSDFDCEVLYASKAFCTKAMIKLVKEYGLSLDVVSGGELYTALQVGFDVNKIYFHGNNKSFQEIDYALDSKVKTFFVDNIMEAKYIESKMRNQDYTLHVMLRVNPGVEAHTHKYIVTADVDSKFGISIEKKEEIVSLIRLFDENPNIIFDGFHAHIGSQIFDRNAFVAEIEVMCQFMHEMQEEYGIVCHNLDLGGGFAAYYTAEDHPIPLDEVCQTIVSTCAVQKEKYNLSFKKIMIEPGRSIVAEAGSTLYTVGFSKETLHKKYVFIDGGMTDNIRPALYQAAYDCDIANKMDEEKTEKVCVAGKCCESGDVIIEETMLQKADMHDLLITYTTGAYGFSMSSNYNRIARPAVVFVENGKSRLVVKRQSYEDLVNGEIE